MNLAMMRDIDRADPIGGLGPKVTPAPTPAPAPVRRPDGIVVDSDGKMSTDLPLPPPEPSWPFPTGAAAPAPEPEPGAHGFMRGQVIRARVEGDQVVCETVREPLKVGDKVRILRGAARMGVAASEIGAVAEVIRFNGSDLYAKTSFAAPMGWCLGIAEYGEEWERVNEL